MTIKLNIVEAIPTSFIEDISDETWIVINSDRSQSPVSSTQFKIRKTIYIDSSVSIAVNTTNLDNGYLYITLCIYDVNKEDIVPLARTKVKIGNIPLDGSSHFQIPLYGVLNPEDQIMTLTLSGSLIKSDKNISSVQKITGSNTYIF